MLYEVNEEKLLELVQKVYDEAITGYSDLKDSWYYCSPNILEITIDGFVFP